MEKLSKELSDYLAATYRKMGDKRALLMKFKLPDGSEKGSWTGNEIADEIDKGTQFGIDMIKKILALTVDLLSRDKLNAN